MKSDRAALERKLEHPVGASQRCRLQERDFRALIGVECGDFDRMTAE